MYFLFHISGILSENVSKIEQNVIKSGKFRWNGDYSSQVRETLLVARAFVTKVVFHSVDACTAI